MPSTSISIGANASAIEALLAEFLQAPLQVLQAFVHGVEALGQAAWTARIDADLGTAPGAPDLRVVLEPSQALLELAAALRAGHLDLVVVEQSSHGHPSRGVV